MLIHLSEKDIRKPRSLCYGVSPLLGPLSVYVLLSFFQLEYFLPTPICSEIPLCVWRANYFSVTYTNSMIFPPSVSFDFGLSFCFISTKETHLLSIPFSLRISRASKPSQNGELQVQWEPVSQKLKWTTLAVETQPILLASTCMYIDTYICTYI